MTNKFKYDHPFVGVAALAVTPLSPWVSAYIFNLLTIQNM